MFNFKKTKHKSKTSNINITLRNFLAEIMDNIDDYSKELSDEYSEKEKLEFIYNCVINTINEFLYSEHRYLNPRFAYLTIIKLFRENILLQQFDKRDIKPNVEKSTEEVIDKFQCIKSHLSNNQKNEIMQEVNNLITSTV